MVLDSASVGIVVRTRNRPLFLARALEDIFGQNFSDFTVVVVNDGGAPADVEQVVSAVPGGYRERITVLHRPESRGMEAASNAGIRACSSTYIAIHDDDDLWHPDFLKRTVDCLESTAAAGVMVRTNIRYEQMADGEIREIDSVPFWPDMKQISLGSMLRINQAVPISFLYRRSLHDELGYYDESLEVVGDWEFHLRVLSRHTLEFLDGEPLAFWCQRPDASGDSANSVNNKADAHRRFDARVRDSYLRDDISRHGMGSLLHLTKLLARQEELLDENRRRMEEMEHRLNESFLRLEDTVVRRTSLSSSVGRMRSVAERIRSLTGRTGK